MRLVLALLLVLLAVLGLFLWTAPGGPDPGAAPARSTARAGATPEAATASTAPAPGAAPQAAGPGDEAARTGLGGPAAAGPGAAAPAPAVLSLRLLDPAGAPARGARLVLEAGRVTLDPELFFSDFRAGPALQGDEPAQEVEADPEGRVRLEGVPAWRPLTLRPGGPHWSGQPVAVAPLAPGEERDLGGVHLAPAARITGTVRRPDGKPAGGATVRLTRPVPDSFFRSPRAVARTEADEEGRYALEGVLPGRYALVAQLQGWTEARVSPLVVDRTGTDIPADLVLGEGFQVRVRVVDDAGQPVPEARVLVSRHRGGRLGLPDSRQEVLGEGLPVDEKGEAVLRGLPLEDPVRLAATAPGFAVARSEVLAPGQRPVLTLARAAVVTGRVLTPDGRPAAGASILLLRAGEDGDWPGRRYRTEAGEDGGFAFEEVEPGPYRLKAAAPDGRAERDFEATPELEPLEIRLAPAAGLVVTVVDDAGEAVPGARVVARRDAFPQFTANGRGRIRFSGEPGQAEPHASAETDAAGRCTFSGLTPGPWNLQASRGDHVASTTRVEVAATGSEARLVLPRAARLRVRVLDAAGNPVPRASIRAVPLEEQEPVPVVQSDLRGVATWPALAPGRWGLRVDAGAASSDGFGQSFLFDDLDAEEAPAGPPEVDLETVLLPGALAEETLVVEGLALPRILVRRLGRPVAGAWVFLQPAPEDGEEEADSSFFFGGEGRGLRSDGAGVVEPGPVPPGRYLLQGRVDTGAPATRLEVELGPGPQEIRLDLASGVVRGTVVDAAGPVANARVTLAPGHEEEDGQEGQRRSVRVVAFAVAGDGGEPVIQTVEQRPGATTTATAGDGSWVLEGVPEGRWVVEIRAPGHSPWTGEPFPHDGRQDLDLGLQRIRGAAVLTGTILGLAPAGDDAGFFIRFLELEAEGDQGRRFAAMKPDGRYRFGDLAPGRYRLKVREGGETWTSPWIEVEADRETPYDFQIGG